MIAYTQPDYVSWLVIGCMFALTFVVGWWARGRWYQ